MKTCLIYGNNGLDLDVTYNLCSLYKELDFKVFFSLKMRRADLLVVTRAMDKKTEILPDYSLIHIYDYTGWDYDAFLLNTDYSRTFIFTTSKTRRTRLVEKINFPVNNIFLALPPVDVSLWSRKIKNIKYNLIHIGNRKPPGKPDKVTTFFTDAIGYFKPDIWGDGWKEFGEISRGKAPLMKVSSIYSSSKFAFGLMYPFQREHTFSGRFWHAPLNGCSLLSEPGLYTKIPGILETDFSIDDIIKKLESDPDRSKIQKDSREFWKTQYLQTQQYAAATLYMLTNVPFKPVCFLTYLRIKGFNLMIKAYQNLKSLRR